MFTRSLRYWKIGHELAQVAQGVFILPARFHELRSLIFPPAMNILTDFVIGRFITLYKEWKFL